MEYLSKLFGSPARVKLLRLFLFNQDSAYDRDSVVKIARLTPETASKELTALARAEIVKRKTIFKEGVRPGNKTSKKRKTIGWVLNQKYVYLESLTKFMRESFTVSNAEISKRFRGAGTIKLLVLSGFFSENKEGSLDVLVVGDRLKEHIIKNAIQSLEAECGQEIRYMVITTDEYHYRRRVRDKFMREVFDYRHIIVINRLSKI